ncbi:hypothetical protein CEXT_773301 [Caerostris extrusa]|uniref:Uncharacterized protein n=1 Tax=Caerostris extrusa TaxID=172846 RepID=A0AAV4MVY8_CAEEX|nr:hypothetical protein CEXT_773301 [Caerostris extrusa]
MKLNRFVLIRFQHAQSLKGCTCYRTAVYSKTRAGLFLVLPRQVHLHWTPLKTQARSSSGKLFFPTSKKNVHKLQGRCVPHFGQSEDRIRFKVVGGQNQTWIPNTSKQRKRAACFARDVFQYKPSACLMSPHDHPAIQIHSHATGY